MRKGSQALSNHNPQSQKTWEYSSEYSNVIIVKTWREKMDDQKEIEALLPTWRKTLLAAHGVVTKVGNTIAFPFVWVAEQFNGTQDHKDKWEKIQHTLKKDSDKYTDNQ